VAQDFVYDGFGWPLCPGDGCGQDSLVSSHFAFAADGSIPPSLSQYYLQPLRCTECAWEGTIAFPKPWEYGAA